MNRPIKYALAPLVLALFAQAGIAHAAEKQAWLVESRGFAQTYSVDLVLKVEDSRYWASQKDMESLGFDLSKLPTVNGMIDLASAGELEVDELNQTISLKVKTELLPENSLDFRTGLQSKIPGPAASGSLLNYDIRATRNETTNVAGVFDASTYVLGDVRANVQALVRGGQIGQQSRTERIAANLSKNDARSGITWTAGDTYSVSGQGINPVNFTGFQVKRNFSLQTGFVAQPTYDLKGAAAAPSALDVYIDNRKVMSSEIPAGPFSLKNLAGLEGASNARIVVRDAFGHEQIIRETLFGGPELLRENLSSFALQGGLMRPSNSETDGKFVSGYYRYGLTNFLTAEVNAEKSYDGTVLRDVSHVGGAVALSTPLGNFSWSGRRGTGSISTLGYQLSVRKKDWSANFNANKTDATEDYIILGTRGPSVQSRRSLQASLMMDNGFGMSILNTVTTSDANTGITINYRQRKAYATNYSLTLNKSKFGDKSDTSVFLAASIPINFGNTNRNRMLSARGGRDMSDTKTQSVEYYDTPTGMFGTSFKLREEGPEYALRYDTEITHRSQRVEVGLASSGTADATGYRAHMRGALVAHDGHIGAMRYVDGGYAIVDAGAPDVKVLVDGQNEGSTDHNGVAFVPIIMPYTRASISLDPETVPVNYDNNTEHVATHQAGGVKAKFRGTVASMVQIAGITTGNLTVNGQPYPITDRGAFIELPEGQYVGTTDQGKTVTFEIPRFSKSGISYVKGTIK